MVNGHGEDKIEAVRHTQQSLSTKILLAAGRRSVVLAKQLGRYLEVDIDTARCHPANEREVPKRPAESIVEILLTSGTTGPPKAVGCTQAGLEFALRQVVSAPSDSFPDQSAFVHHVMPGTQAAQRVLVQALRGSRLTSIGVGSLSSEQFVEAVEIHKASRFVGMVPLTARQIVRQCRRDDVLLPSVRWVSVGSAHVPPRLLEDIAQICPAADALNMYGSTEAGVARIYSRYPGRPGSLGRPEQGTVVEVRDDDGLPLPRGVRGELWIRSPGCPPRCYLYVNDPVRTELVFREGWVKTGDLATEDEDGFVYLVGRRSEMICLAGREVSPDEIEDCLLDHELVNDVAVYGAPAESGGKEIVAAVVRAAFEMSPAAMRRVLEEHCRNRLQPFQVPGRFLWLDALPTGQFATVQTRELRARHRSPS